MLFSVIRGGGNLYAMPLWEPCTASTAHYSIRAEYIFLLLQMQISRYVIQQPRVPWCF